MRQFAAHKRSLELRDQKRVKAFRDIQARLKDAVPKEFSDLIRRSKTGIRIVSDAPLEWFDLDGIPLALAANTSRIPTTPGNAFVTLMLPRPVLRLSPEAFREILIVNAVKKTDPVYPFFVTAMEQYSAILKDKVQIKQVEVASRQEFIKALNDFTGVFMIFNGHGSHDEDDAGVLWLQDESLDVWTLRDELINAPPIVLLSACDTQAADRNHATAAQGFLTLGSITVLGSFFPLPALDAAVFAARLILRVVEFIPAAINAFGRVLTWSEVASGMIRRTLLTDFLMRLERDAIISEAQSTGVHLSGNEWIDTDAPAPFERVIAALADFGIPESQLRSEFRAAIATSTAISYVQLGRPENIIFDTEKRMMAQADELRNEAEQEQGALLNPL